MRPFCRLPVNRISPIDEGSHTGPGPGPQEQWSSKNPRSGQDCSAKRIVVNRISCNGIINSEQEVCTGEFSVA